MARQFQYIVSGNGTVHIFANGVKFEPITQTHPGYAEVCKALTNPDTTIDELYALNDIKSAIEVVTQGKLSVSGGLVKYGDFILDHTPMITHLLNLISEGQDINPVANFIDNLMENPSKASVDQLWGFLDQQGLPITEDGCFLAYKAVDKNFMDKWSHKYDNSVGQVVKMSRNQVTDDPSRACASGLHCGSLQYVGWYGRSGDKIILVKVNPKDAVSVPTNEATDKLRVCEYTVVEHYGDYDHIYENQKSDRLLSGALYDTNGQRVEPNRLKEDIRGMFDNAESDHWNTPSNAPYLSREDEDEDNGWESWGDCPNEDCEW
jgi:hypothetical protein